MIKCEGPITRGGTNTYMNTTCVWVWVMFEKNIHNNHKDDKKVEFMLMYILLINLETSSRVLLFILFTNDRMDMLHANLQKMYINIHSPQLSSVGDCS